MPRVLLPGILLSCLGLAGPVVAQTTETVVIVPAVDVRSGPTLQYYATGRLKQGDRVTVVSNDSKAQPGWLAVKPPPGSFSWINARYVKQDSPHSGVVTEEAPVLPGSAVTNQAPNVEQVKVKPGFIVAILDRPLQVEGGTWLPIVPPPGEVRYLPASAVNGGGTVVVRPAPGGAVPAAGGNSLLAQADQAYLAGQLEQAKKLYKEAADKTTDQSQKIYCYNRLASLNKGSWNPPPAQGVPQNNLARGPQPAPAAPPVPSAWTAPPSAQTTSLYRNSGLPAHPTQWSPWGQLRRTAFDKEGQPMYVLENRQGQPLLYVTTAPGVSLQPYLGQTVSLFGTVMYRSDDYLRANYLVASHVALP